MKKSETTRFLRLLEQDAGGSIKWKTLVRKFNSRLELTGKKSRKKRKSDNNKESAFSPELIVAELDILGLLKKNNRGIEIYKPFTLRGRVSMSPKGLVFVIIHGAKTGARDIFVAPKYSKCAISGDEVEVQLIDRRRDRFEGRIIRIIKRARSRYRLRLLSKQREGYIPGIILDVMGKIPACIPVSQIPAPERSRIVTDAIVIVSLVGKEVRFLGTYFQQSDFIGFEKDQKGDYDLNRILLKYDLKKEYPQVMKRSKALKEPDAAHVHDWKIRHDLRDIDTITIDGEFAKDFDDALSLITTTRSYWTLYVHIADVGYYVKPGTSLDSEARQRATSVYLGSHTVPMLPPELSENLCSLVAGKNRLCFTAEMRINPKTGIIVSSKLYKSVIKVDRRLTYEIAEKEIEREEKKSEKTRSTLSQMWHLAQKQKRERLKRGRIDLNLPEPKIVTGTGGAINAVEYPPRLRSNMLIEEFMLSANETVARFIRKKKIPVLYRIHEDMEESKLDRLNNFLEIYNINYRIKDSSPKSIQKVLDIVSTQQSTKPVERVFNIILLRSFMQARYSGEPTGHWGLGFSDYCHFTSPIRRYPDLIVHRVLDGIIRKKGVLYSASQIAEMGVVTSNQERKSMEAERDFSKLRMIRYLEKIERRKFHGLLTGIRPERLFFELQELPLEGVVRHSHLTNEGELIIPNDFSVYVKKLSRPVFLGEKWELELEEIDTEAMVVFLKPIWDGMNSPFQSE